MKKYLLLLGCVLFVLVDLVTTYMQHSTVPLDGDIVPVVLPSASLLPVMHNPFGQTAILRDTMYAAPNRFFAHATQMVYFRTVPGTLQAAGLTPIASLYAAQALAATLMQALLLYLLAVYVVGTGRLSSRPLWLVMALLAPFFQTQGYGVEMALVPQAISYAFFYALPLVWLLLLLRPYYRWASGQGWRLSGVEVLGSLGLLVVLAFNGPLIPGIVAVLLAGAGWHWWRTAPAPASGGRLGQLRRVPAAALGLALVAGGLCLYSLYLGRYNAENLWQTMPLLQRYQLLPRGIWQELTGVENLNLGFSLLIGACLTNAYLLKHAVTDTPESRRLRAAHGWLAGLTVLYLLLLPLGGYRSYRPYLLRFDTIAPITLALVLCYGASAYYLLHHLAGWVRTSYRVAVVLLLATFAYADRHLSTYWGNGCERAALAYLAKQSPPGPVKLPERCSVLSWQPITSRYDSELQARMLYYWGVTPNGKCQYYCQ